LDGKAHTYDEHEDSVYGLAWSMADPWLCASLSYDGRVVVNRWESYTDPFRESHTCNSHLFCCTSHMREMVAVVWLVQAGIRLSG
jgi:WD40 repeat protein